MRKRMSLARYAGILMKCGLTCRSPYSAAAFMITGPATKITNLGALKIVLGIKRFALYLVYVMMFSFLSGLVVNVIYF